MYHSLSIHSSTDGHFMKALWGPLAHTRTLITGEVPHHQQPQGLHSRQTGGTRLLPGTTCRAQPPLLQATVLVLESLNFTLRTTEIPWKIWRRIWGIQSISLEKLRLSVLKIRPKLQRVYAGVQTPETCNNGTVLKEMFSLLYLKER